MATTQPNVTGIADALLGAAPTLDSDEQRLVVGLYRALATGEPVSPFALAERLGVPADLVNTSLDSWPGVYRNSDGEVIGFWGLALSGMPHDLTVGEATINAWCALDPLLIVPLLEMGEANVRSSDPVTGEEVTLTITRDGVTDVRPESAVVSILEPEGEFDHDVVARFCHYVWFFASSESGKQWISEHPGTFLITVEEANLVARGSWPKLIHRALGD